MVSVACVQTDRFPRISIRGFIEACLLPCPRGPLGKFPRISIRGFIEAEYVFLWAGMVALHFREFLFAALLKRRPFRWRPLFLL